MSSTSGSGGVRNLRAMFENRTGDTSTSPPSRGPSPNPSEISNSSRPVSKVRASFVAVERPGENGTPTLLGLRRTSEVSSMSEIKEHAIVDDTTDERADGLVLHDVTQKPVSAQASRPPANGQSRSGLGHILKGSEFVENGTPSKPPKDVEARKLGDALSSRQTQQQISQSPAKAVDSTKAASMVEQMQTAKDKHPDPPPRTQLQTTKAAQPVKPPPTRQIITKANPKSPTQSKPSPKTPTSPSMQVKGGAGKIKGVMESAKHAQHARATKQSTLQAPKGDTAPKVNVQTKTKPTIDTMKRENAPAVSKAMRSPTVAKPKGQTTPVKLPSAATTSTAAFSAKESHRSPTEANHKPTSKKNSSLAVKPPRVSTASVTSSLVKKPSRASLANGYDRPKSRVSVSKPDDGFLARMMRPTTSSSQKTHDKVQINSPPRTKTASSHKSKEHHHKAPPPKMHAYPTGSENKENDSQVEHAILPQVGPTSPLDVMKEDPMATLSKAEPVVTQPTVTPDQVEEMTPPNGPVERQ